MNAEDICYALAYLRVVPRTWHVSEPSHVRYHAQASSHNIERTRLHRFEAAAQQLTVERTFQNDHRWRCSRNDIFRNKIDISLNGPGFFFRVECFKIILPNKCQTILRINN